MRSAPRRAIGGISPDAPREDLEEAVRAELLAIADRLLQNAGFSSQFKGGIYDALLEHVKTKFLDGASIGQSERHRLESAWRLLPQAERTIGGYPGLVEGMVKHGD